MSIGGVDTLQAGVESHRTVAAVSFADTAVIKRVAPVHWSVAPGHRPAAPMQRAGLKRCGAAWSFRASRGQVSIDERRPPGDIGVYRVLLGVVRATSGRCPAQSAVAPARRKIRRRTPTNFNRHRLRRFHRRP